MPGRRRGQLAAARAGHTATLLENGKVLVAGGYNSARFHDTAELYDPAENSWAAAATMAGIHIGHTATRLPDGTVLVAGGFGTTLQATAERYDPAANTWTPAGSMTDGRSGHTATLLAGGKVLVAGGVNSTAGGPTWRRPSCTTRRRTAGAPLADGRRRGAATPRCAGR